MGGASLLGSHLCERLLDERHEVIAIDDFSTFAYAILNKLIKEIAGDPRPTNLAAGAE